MSSETKKLPPPEPKSRWRSATTGDLAIIHYKDGKAFARLDRDGQTIERVFHHRDWVEEAEHRPLLLHQVGRIYFEAEKALLQALGDPEGHQMDWSMMGNAARNSWLETQSDNPLVMRLTKAMRKILDPLSE